LAIASETWPTVVDELGLDPLLREEGADRTETTSASDS
jgi:hypothetical protein